MQALTHVRAGRPSSCPLHRRAPREDEGFTLVEVVIAISLLLIVMMPFSKVFITGIGVTASARTRDVAVMIADGALDNVRALQATDLSQGVPVPALLYGRTASAVSTEWTSANSVVAQALTQTNQVSDPTTTDNPATLPTTPTYQTVNGIKYAVSIYVGTCYQQASGGACTQAGGAGSHQLYRVLAAVTWNTSQGGCGTSGCTYIASTLISPTQDPTFYSRANTVDCNASQPPPVQLSRVGWTLSANYHNVTSGTDNLSQAVDGNLGTRWSTENTSQVPGMWFEVNMGSPHGVSGLEMLTADWDSGDYAGDFQVLVSADGVSWTNVTPTACTGSSRTEIVTFPQVAAVQYVRVVLTTNTNKWEWWSIHEFYLYANG